LLLRKPHLLVVLRVWRTAMVVTLRGEDWRGLLTELLHLLLGGCWPMMGLRKLGVVGHGEDVSNVGLFGG
jgi:hypothetical protein